MAGYCACGLQTMPLFSMAPRKWEMDGSAVEGNKEFLFRVDPAGEVYMLECQPVCSFAKQSAMIGMALKTDVPELQHPTLYHTMLRRAAARKPKPYDPTQTLGMKAK